MEDKRIESIGNTLRFFRAALNFRQKEMLTMYADHSVYSKTENNERNLQCIELFNILDNSSIDMFEFISYMTNDDPQKEYVSKYFEAAEDLDNEEKKEILMQYLHKLMNTFPKNGKTLSSIISIKTYFSQHWENMPNLKEEELFEAYDYLFTRKYFLKCDYHLLSNLIHLLSKQKRKDLMRKAFPLKDIEKRDYESLKFAFSAIPNATTLALQEQDYEEAREYISYHNQLDNKNDYIQFKLDSKYLENLLHYLETGDNKILPKIYNYLAVLEDIGYIDQAERVNKEIKMFVYGKVNRSDISIELF